MNNVTRVNTQVENGSEQKQEVLADLLTSNKESDQNDSPYENKQSDSKSNGETDVRFACK